MKLARKRIAIAALVAGVVVIGALMLRPDSVPVTTDVVARGPLRVTIDEEGVTRVRDDYEVTAPVAGRLRPITLRVGDAVDSGATVAWLEPLPLDPRTRAELEAAVTAAEAAQREADALVAQARALATEARAELERVRALVAAGAVPERDLERAATADQTAVAQLVGAEEHARGAAAGVRSARASLIGAAGGAIRLVAPARGRILHVFEEHDRVIAPGTGIVAIGDPGALEMVIDVLSTDARAVEVGARVIAGIGGGDSLVGRVRRVEPVAFTEVSPLGIDEQRVNVIADFVRPTPDLGHGYRIDARIVLWDAPDVLLVPTSALYRHEEGWAVFVVGRGRARARDVTIGHRGAAAAEVLGGLAAGDTVVVHPDDAVADGVRVKISP
jgi:HlyD family secretion protein